MRAEWSREKCAAVAQVFRNWQMLQEAPARNDLPSKETVAREAELAMWMAWGATLELPWWNDAYERLDDRDHFRLSDWRDVKAYNAVNQLEPILDHLREPKFGGKAQVKSAAVYYQWEDWNGNMHHSLDVRKMQVLGLGESDMLKNFSEIAFPGYVRAPTSRIEFLSKFKDHPPSW